MTVEGMVRIILKEYTDDRVTTGKTFEDLGIDTGDFDEIKGQTKETWEIDLEPFYTQFNPQDPCSRITVESYVEYVAQQTK